MDSVILHIHIPKAGGGTLQGVLYREYQQESLGQGEVGCFDSGIYWYPCGFEPDTYTVEPSEVHNALARRSDIRMVSGHFPYGIHKFLKRPFKYVTVLRDPVDRVASLYEHLRRYTYNIGPIHDVALRLPIAEFVKEAKYRPIDNGQVRQLTGLYPPFGQCTEDMLEAAKRNLSNFAVVGILERFDDTLRVMSTRLGWRDKCPEYEYRHRGLDPCVKVDPDTAALVRRYNELDWELYHFAKGLHRAALGPRDT